MGCPASDGLSQLMGYLTSDGLSHMMGYLTSDGLSHMMGYLTSDGLSHIRGVRGSDVRLGTNAMRPDDHTTSILCTSAYLKHLTSLSGTKVDPISACASPGKRARKSRQRTWVGSRSVNTRATDRTQHASMHVPSGLRSQLRQGHPGCLYGCPKRAHSSLRSGKLRVSTRSANAASVHTSMRECGHNCARAVVLAVRVGPPRLVLRPGPIHGMGRAARCRAHAHTGPASANASMQGGERLTFARTFFARPAQAHKVFSAHRGHHEDMRRSRWHGRVDRRAHLLAGEPSRCRWC